MGVEVINPEVQLQEIAIAQEATTEEVKVEKQTKDEFDPTIQDDNRKCGSCPRDYNI